MELEQDHLNADIAYEVLKKRILLTDASGNFMFAPRRSPEGAAQVVNRQQVPQAAFKRAATANG
jgi:hypothetical protein